MQLAFKNFTQCQKLVREKSLDWKKIQGKLREFHLENLVWTLRLDYGPISNKRRILKCGTY